MSEKVKLKKKYVKLIQDGKEVEALKVLRQVQNFGKEVVEKIDEKVTTKKSSEKKVTKKKVLSEPRFKNIEDLSKIKGIGNETINDLKSLYGSLADLILHIKSGKNLPVRNDVDNKLRKELI